MFPMAVTWSSCDGTAVRYVQCTSNIVDDVLHNGPMACHVYC